MLSLASFNGTALAEPTAARAGGSSEPAPAYTAAPASRATAKNEKWESLTEYLRRGRRFLEDPTLRRPNETRLSRFGARHALAQGHLSYPA